MLRKLIELSGPIRYWFDRLTYDVSDQDLHLLKNKYQGYPMLVVGNGPSLNVTPLEEFVTIPSIGMNKIELLFDRSIWRPSMIVCVNNLVVKQNWKNWLKRDIPVHLSWKARHFIPSKQREKFSFFLSKRDILFSRNITKFLGSAVTVTFTALQYAYYMGADPVILVGVDHSFSVTNGRKPNDIEKRKGEDINHFDPNYFAAGSYWGVPDLDASEAGFRLAKEAFEMDGRKVYDATIGGKLDVFEKLDISDAINISKEIQ